MSDTPGLRLMHLSHGAGCACKLGMTELTHILQGLLPSERQDAVMVDAFTSDDAAVYRLDVERALVVTTDFFAPVVDDAFDFGRIAATNAVSDVYAMGGRPLFGLNLVAFPRKLLGDGILAEILRGGGEACREAGIPVLGGHSIDDPEPKFGMVVVGEVHPDKVVTNRNALPGDLLVLTKPLGTGVVTTALKAGAAPPEALEAAVASMTTLNRAAAEAMERHGVTTATDVTGYGLLGHLRNVTRASGVRAEVWAGDVPLLPGAEALAEAGHVPGGTRRNLDDLMEDVLFDAAVSDTARTLLADAQTSGGLLMAVPPARLDALMADLKTTTPAAAAVGQIVDGRPGSIAVL